MQTKQLFIKDWEGEDFTAFYRLNNDEKVMEFFPHRLNHQEAFEKFTAILKPDLTTGIGIKALQQKSSGKIIGMCGLIHVNLPDFFPNNTVEIMWRILPEFQRQGFAFEAAHYMIKQGFINLNINTIIAFTAATNQPSLKLMQKLGMQESLQKRFMHPKVPDSHPRLKLHRTFEIEKQNKL
ncbi:GNAT family N-acetyltransferase [Bartonella sp. HY329]|uniref:GNAT family N-acetyltransferase n=1 Tax=unclassified Bartonella TaxID=2645622 RepID=UPI0021CAD9FA|nr:MULTISPECIES: GNAT family N-acetyltransferase [unclassified Bartonella]UXM94507.1 GNAT family N-acetyltransferase [Bartonella sp. HY329]UXN08831.1 GNAT family N-acetyltransferase [Bartonella sp. HY328]